MQDNSISDDILLKLKKIKRRFEQIFDLIILYTIGNSDNVKNSLWNALKNFRKLGEKKFNKIITNKIDYCVIYSIKCDNVILKKLFNKDKRDTDDMDDTEVQNLDSESCEIKYSLNDKLVSFYFLFICLDDENKNSNLENSDVVSW